MPAFGRTSRERLATCDPRLATVFERVVEIMDCTILDGHRDKAAQDAAVAAKKSKTPWPRSKHNTYPSQAVDVAPWPIPAEWHPYNFILLAGIVRGVAADLGIAIRWGGDWDGDFDIMDNHFNDFVHFELKL